MRDLTEARVEAGLTQTRLAEIIGVSRNTIGNWERGVTMPDAHQRRALEEALLTRRAPAPSWVVITAPARISGLDEAGLPIVEWEQHA